MKPSEIAFNNEISNRDKFGYYLKTRRNELCLTIRELAGKLLVSPAYISDIEQGNRKSPIEHLNKLAQILDIEESELEFFYDISGCTHSNWPEINEYLESRPTARKAVRLARDKGLSEEEFFGLVTKLTQQDYLDEPEK